MENVSKFDYVKNMPEYTMSDTEIDEMFEKVKALVFSNIAPEIEQPIAVITGGQPGAGKSGLVIKSKLDLANMNKEAVVLDVDVYRGLCKNASILAKEYPQYYSEITDQYVGKVMARLVEYALVNNYNIIFEGTLGNTKIIENIRTNGKNYKIIARLMAVSKEESMLSIFERYIEMNKNMGGLGRLTSIDAHNVRYDSFTKIAETLERHMIETEVYERSDNKKVPIEIYRTSDKARRYSCVKEALYAGRHNSYKKCIKEAEERIEAINEDIKKCAVDDKIMCELGKLNDYFSIEFEKKNELKR